MRDVIFLVGLFFFLISFINALNPIPAINIDPWNQQYGLPSSQVLNDLGAKWVRIELKDLTSNSSSSFAFYDPIIKNYVQNGLKILLLIDYATLPGRPSPNDPDSKWDEYINRFAERSQEIAQHYQQSIDCYEIWNEEDLTPSPSYDPYVPSVHYAKLLSSSYQAIKKVSPFSQVIVGGLASGQVSYLEQVVHYQGGTLIADGVGLHPYGRRPFPNWPSPTWGFGALTPFLKAYENVVAKPIWITEIGTNQLNVQGDFPMKTFQDIEETASDIAPIVFWFCWSDGMVEPFGVVDKNGNRKPSYYSFQKYALNTTASLLTPN